MIKTEYFKTRDDGVILVKTYSTDNKYIKQLETNLEYDFAIDVGVEEKGVYKPKKYTYEETDVEIKDIDEVLTE
jgi:hypothetical protein